MLVQKNPRFHQIVTNKRSKEQNFPGGACMPPDPPSLLHALHTDTYLLPTPLGKKLKETLLKECEQEALASYPDCL